MLTCCLRVHFREILQNEVSYVFAPSYVSQEDRLLIHLGGADKPVGVFYRLKFSLMIDFCLVEDKSPVRVIAGEIGNLL